MPRKAQKSVNPEPAKPRKKALTPEGRENQLISLAMNVAEEQMRNGTASPQVISHFLKMGSSKNRFEVEKLKRENELLEAKTESIKASQHADEMYAQALQAMRTYGGSMFGSNDETENI